MNTPSVNEQLRAMGLNAPTPTRDGMRVSRMQRVPFGEKKRQMVRTEEGMYPAFEQTLQLHGLDFWHCTVAQRSQPGWPDYAIFGRGWLAFVELKARSLTTNRKGKVMPEQERWRDAIRLAGGEWRTFLLPDQWDDLDDWLTSHTGKTFQRSGR